MTKLTPESCPSCGTDLDDEFNVWEYCPLCGANLFKEDVNEKKEEENAH